MRGKNSLMAVGLTTALTFAALVPAEAQQTKPNVVIMLADNLGYGDLSAYNDGIRGYETERLDKLASEGLRFTQFLVEPGCTPSRAALQTGRYSVRSGLSLVIAPGTPATLQAEEITLGELFKSADYSTAYFCKWHLGPEPQSLPTAQGYDEWRIGFYGTSDVSQYRKEMTRNRMPEPMIDAITANYSIFEVTEPGGKPRILRPYDLEYRKRIEGHIASEAIRYINSKSTAGEPFFIQIGWTRPHFPNLVTEEFADKSGIGRYGDSLLDHDHQVGRVLDALEELGIVNDTIVVWISDNGPTRTTANIEELNMGSAGPFSGELGDGKEGSIRTAGMIRWPGKIEPGVSNEMIAIHDFFPTLAKIIGAKVPDDRPIDGVDQSNWLLGGQQKSNRDSLITFVGDRIVAVRWKQFRFYPVSFTPQPTNPRMMGYGSSMLEHAGYPNMFNIEEDPREERPVLDTGIWSVGQYLRIIGEYQATLKKDPNAPAFSMTDFRK